VYRSVDICAVAALNAAVGVDTEVAGFEQGIAAERARGHGDAGQIALLTSPR
jgi:hypothetical protein